MTDRKAQSASALRRRRQAVKKLRAELKRELAAIEAEMESRKGGPNYTKTPCFQGFQANFMPKMTDLELHPSAPVDAARKLTPDQERFHAAWRGPIWIVTSLLQRH